MLRTARVLQGCAFQRPRGRLLPTTVTHIPGSALLSHPSRCAGSDVLSSSRRCASTKAAPSYALYLVSDDAFLDNLFLAKVAAALEGGVTMMQLRAKHAPTADLVRLAEVVKTLTKPRGVPLIIDDRLDVALAVDADGLHVGEEDLPWEIARRLLGPGKILGCSTYGREDLLRRALHPEVNADYVATGSIFGSPTKPSSVAKGLHHVGPLRDLVHSIKPVPLVAIGGIGKDAAADCIRSGADGVAVVSALLAHEDPATVRQTAEFMAKSILQASEEVSSHR